MKLRVDTDPVVALHAMIQLVEEQVANLAVTL